MVLGNNVVFATSVGVKIQCKSLPRRKCWISTVKKQVVYLECFNLYWLNLNLESVFCVNCFSLLQILRVSKDFDTVAGSFLSDDDQHVAA